jgi:hypothetical protein
LPKPFSDFPLQKHADGHTFRSYCGPCIREKKRLEQSRHTPKPLSQGGGLPPLGVLIIDDDGSRIQCHVCGRFYRSLVPRHIAVHGLTDDAYRERFELSRRQSLSSPASQERRRQAALRNGAGLSAQEMAELSALATHPTGGGTRLGSRINKSRAQLLRRSA